MILTREARQRYLQKGILLVPEKEHQTELMVSNSRFIATCAGVFSTESAREYISELKRKYSDASHNVPAYIIGHGNSTMSFSSDDGEPSGSAGKPVLAVLEGSGLGDCIIVVTRYFGGTKLGIGGLVHAYADAAKQVLAELSYAAKVQTRGFELTVPYEFYERVRQLLESSNVTLIHTDFQEVVRIQGEIIENRLEPLSQIISENTFGKVNVCADPDRKTSIYSLEGLLE